MGLAAAQARLLTLQSRMNDPELRCMQLSNQQITNSIKSSNLSIQYNNKLQAINTSSEYAPEEVISNKNVTSGSSSITSNTLKLRNNGTYVEFDYNKLKEMGFDIAPAGSSATEVVNGKDVSYNYETNSIVEEAKKNSQALVEGILSGSITLYKGGYPATLDEVGLEEIQVVEGTESWSETSFTHTLDYSKRDAARQEVENWYNGEVSKLSREEKVLEVQSKSANTEYQAASTEYESVKNLISENSDRSFSIWS